jgi:integrase
VRGLWRRNGRFVARITVEQTNGSKKVKWTTLKAVTAAGAVEELKAIHVERRESRLRPIGLAPKLSDYILEYYKSLDVSDKQPATIQKERGCLARWSDKLGHWRLDQLLLRHIRGFVEELKRDKLSGRTANIYVIALRHVMKRAREDGYIFKLPTDGLGWQKSDTESRPFISQDELSLICKTAVKASRNGSQLADYLKLMAYSGARRNEALNLRWKDVHFDRKQLTIVMSKNRKPRSVDFVPALEAHLLDMHQRRAPDSVWLFPSPQRGEEDRPTKTFMESLRLTRALLPNKLKGFGFHDCRHFFVSFCVMSGLDFMTIARWVGHRDGGVLIGKVYGHLSNEHTQAQAARVTFGPAVLPVAVAS